MGDFIYYIVVNRFEMETNPIRISNAAYRRLWSLKTVERKTITDVITYLLDFHDRQIEGGPGA